MATSLRHPLAQALGRAGYHVTSAGGWITVAGHRAIHRFRGWRSVPWAPAWRASLSCRAAGTGWAFALSTPLGDVAWSAGGHGTGLQGFAALMTAAVTFQCPALVGVSDDARLVRRATAALTDAHPPWSRSVRRRLQDRPISVVMGALPVDDPAVVALRALNPRPAPAFDPARIAGSGPRVIAHGTRDYVLDLVRGTCSCPAFRYGRRPCKHLIAAQATAPGA